jgi:glycosyltransferase involved in cell wall biosynthesis
MHMMASLPQVSIVMPLRNAAGTLAAAFESIRLQSFHDWELVAVEDGSSDETAAILESFGRSDARVRVLSQEALGICMALKRGCAEARGKYIARMDADDVMSTDRLRRQTEWLHARLGTGVVSCLVRHGGHQQSQAGYAAHVDWINTLQDAREILLRRFVESPIAHPSVMFRRELLGLHGGYACGDFPEDYELWLRWMDAGVQFEKVNAELLTWNDLPERLSRVDPRYSMAAFYRIKCSYLARWIKRHVRPTRQVWLWGAGRITRQRFRALESEDIPIVGFIDVDPAKLGRLRDGRPVVGPGELPSMGRAFILAGVAARGARQTIAAELNRLGWMEGADYLLVA